MTGFSFLVLYYKAFVSFLLIEFDPDIAGLIRFFFGSTLRICQFFDFASWSRSMGLCKMKLIFESASGALQGIFKVAHCGSNHHFCPKNPIKFSKIEKLQFLRFKFLIGGMPERESNSKKKLGCGKTSIPEIFLKHLQNFIYR